MKELKKITAMLAASALLLPVFACTNTGSSQSNDSTADSSAIVDPNLVTDENGGPNHKLSFNEYIVDANGEPISPSLDGSVDGTTPVQDGEGPNAIVTTLKKDGQIYSPVTDINGVTVTDDAGVTQTEVYTGTTLATTCKDPEYVPNYRSYLAFWLDISKKEDYVFDGNLVELRFKINDDCPDGVYPIQLHMPDFANYDGETYTNVKCNVGYICVNADKPENVDTTLGEGMTLTPETVTAKQGETVRVNIRIDNNDGIAAFRFCTRFDSNAMTLSKAGGGSDLASKAPLTANEPVAD